MMDENENTEEIEKRFKALLDKIHTRFSEYTSREKKIIPGAPKTYVVTPPRSKTPATIKDVLSALEKASASLDALNGKNYKFKEKTNYDGDKINPHNKNNTFFTKEELLFIEDTLKKLSENS